MILILLIIIILIILAKLKKNQKLNSSSFLALNFENKKIGQLVTKFFLSQTFLFYFFYFLRINTFPKCPRTCILVKHVKSHDSLIIFMRIFWPKKEVSSNIFSKTKNNSLEKFWPLILNMPNKFPAKLKKQQKLDPSLFLALNWKKKSVNRSP
jgi:hypothetical protein